MLIKTYSVKPHCVSRWTVYILQKWYTDLTMSNQRAFPTLSACGIDTGILASTLIIKFRNLCKCAVSQLTFAQEQSFECGCRLLHQQVQNCRQKQRENCYRNGCHYLQCKKRVFKNRTMMRGRLTGWIMRAALTKSGLLGAGCCWNLKSFEMWRAVSNVKELLLFRRSVLLPSSGSSSPSNLDATENISITRQCEKLLTRS